MAFFVCCTCFAEMGIPVTGGAKGNQVLFGIIAKSASGVDVVDLEVDRTAAVLAAAAIPLQHLLAQLTIGLRVEAKPGPPWAQASHETFLNCSRNCFCCGGGRN